MAVEPTTEDAGKAETEQEETKISKKRKRKPFRTYVSALGLFRRKSNNVVFSDQEIAEERYARLVANSDLYAGDDEDDAEYAAKRREKMEKTAPPPPKRAYAKHKVWVSRD